MLELLKELERRVKNLEVLTSNILRIGNVYANGIQVCRVGDSVCCGLSFLPHPSDGTITQGSSSVFVNGKPIARVGDATSHSACGGGNLESGSPNVFAGG